MCAPLPANSKQHLHCNRHIAIVGIQDAQNAVFSVHYKKRANDCK
jgi:hypothetical protein